jgi:hypothetical protein
VFEAGVEMGLLAQSDDFLKVRIVNVSVDAEETLKNLFDDRLKMFGKGHVHAGRKELVVVETALHPSHQIVNILRG